uniref:Transcription initiation factor TFIID subunit 13 n=2 Tax=Steinernema glaseri TaxID=37863 RepID=A0A1I7ZAK8_9BILA
MIMDEEFFDSDMEEDEEDLKKKGPDEKKFVFRRELRSMLYGYGDEKVPYDKTLELLEQIVIDYIRMLCQSALNVGKTGKISLEDIHYLIRRDAKRFGRVKELLSMSEELKKARKAFEESKVL